MGLVCFENQIIKESEKLIGKKIAKNRIIHYLCAANRMRYLSFNLKSQLCL